MRRLPNAARVFHLPRRPLRLQLALLYSGLFLGLGMVLIAITTGLALFRGSSSSAATPTGEVHSSTHTVATGAALALVITVVLSLVLGWLIAGRFLRPLRAMNAMAREISATNLNRRLDLRGPADELTELGQTLDELFARLDAAFSAQRRFIANAAHELRTPLAAERTLLQVALADSSASAEELRAACEQVLLLGQQQQQLIDALLTLASSESGVEVWHSVNLADVAEDAIVTRAAEAKSRALRIDAHLIDACAAGDPRLIECLVANLIDNAVQHNISSGWVEVVTLAENETAVLTVRNSGPVVPETEVNRLFQPFQRLQDGRIRRGDRHGLGLAIVQAIVNAHGARLTTRALPEGGLDVTVAFNAGPA